MAFIALVVTFCESDLSSYKNKESAMERIILIVSQLVSFRGIDCLYMFLCGTFLEIRCIIMNAPNSKKSSTEKHVQTINPMKGD